jgi:uncharacterized protein YqhQ
LLLLTIIVNQTFEYVLFIITSFIQNLVNKDQMLLKVNRQLILLYVIFCMCFNLLKD